MKSSKESGRVITSLSELVGFDGRLVMDDGRKYSSIMEGERQRQKLIEDLREEREATVAALEIVHKAEREVNVMRKNGAVGVAGRDDDEWTVSSQD